MIGQWADVEKASKEIQRKVENVNGFSFGMRTLPYTFEWTHFRTPRITGSTLLNTTSCKI